MPTLPPAATPTPPDKDGLHPRNRHRGRYDFAQLTATSPELAAYVRPNDHGALSLNFADAAAVKALNRALLRHFYGLEHWDIPAGYLTPPIPGRADYVHYLADLLAADNADVVPRGKALRVLDVGVGASCIYPIIGHHEYGWRFVGTEVDATAVRVARQLVAANRALSGAVDIRQQPHATDVFSGVVKPSEYFDLTMCNPPFHASAAEAAAGSQRKTRNLGTGRGPAPALNFGGQPHELWTPGGEATFLWRMAEESALLRANVYWFSALVSKKDTLPGLYKSLQKLGAAEVRTVPMSQGQKQSRFVAWTFLGPEERQQWRQRRWGAGAA